MKKKLRPICRAPFDERTVGIMPAAKETTLKMFHHNRFMKAKKKKKKKKEFPRVHEFCQYATMDYNSTVTYL